MRGSVNQIVSAKIHPTSRQNIFASTYYGGVLLPPLSDMVELCVTELLLPASFTSHPLTIAPSRQLAEASYAERGVAGVQESK